MAASSSSKVALLKNADGYDEVAGRVSPSADASWDLPSGCLVELIDEWTECVFKKWSGFIKTKNLPVVKTKKSGDMVEVKDSFEANSQTSMRRYAEQDSVVLCYVPNGPAMVQLVETWAECSWFGLKTFVKARHIQPAPEGAAAKPTAAAASTEGVEVDPAAAAEAPADAAAPVAEDEPAAAAAGPEAPAAAAPVAAPAPELAAAAAAAPVADKAAAAAPAGETRDCDCCFDSVELTAGLLCPGKAHFFCGSCLSNFLTAFKTADYADQKKGKGRALCPMKDSGTPFGDGSLVALVPQDVFDEYLQIRIKVAEKGIQEQMEKENQDKIEELKAKLAAATGTAEQMELDKHRLRIIDDIFTLKCPRCGQAFLDYTNCSAVTCAGCKCGFCSYCLEDCGEDAHQHFYQNNSRCPKEDGPLVVAHATWAVFQNKRKARLMCQYLAKLPEAQRKKVVDMVAPDAKDLGVKMPEDLSDVALNPKAYGHVRVRLSVPRKLRGQLAEKAKALIKGSLKLKIPAPKAKVDVNSAAGVETVTAWRVPNNTDTKNVAGKLPNGTGVTVEDQWVECSVPGEKIKLGFVKDKHVLGRATVGTKVILKAAGGHGDVLIRKEAKQAEGANSIKFLLDGTEVMVLRHWIEITWGGDAGWGFMGAPSRGFLQAQDIPEDDVELTGLQDDCLAVASEVEKVLGVKVMAKAAM